MKATLYRRLILVLSLGLLLCAAVSYFTFDAKTTLAVSSGYALFSLNFLMLAKIYSGLMLTMQNGSEARNLRTGILLGSAVKFLGLIAALYLMLVRWEMSGLSVAAGSLASLFVLTLYLLTSYTKSFGNASR